MEVIMSDIVLWINIPLMVLAFSLMVGVPLWFVLCRPSWHTRESRSLPAYMMARQAVVPTQSRSRIEVRAYVGRH